MNHWAAPWCVLQTEQTIFFTYSIHLRHNEHAALDARRLENKMPKVLIVDDSPTALFSLKQIVEQAGHETVTAESGEKAP